MSLDQKPAFEIPAGPVDDLLLKQSVTLRSDATGCSYQGYEFGASYPDSLCIEGLLYDADSGAPASDGHGWNYDRGGEIPCPHCNHATWAESALDELEDAGGDAHAEGKPRDSCPHPTKSRFQHLAAAMAARWHAGWDKAAADG